VYDALRAGHAYLAIELATEVKDFVFMAEDGKQALGIMGDEVTFQPNLQLTAVLPAVAELTLFRNGEPVDHTIGQAWQIPVTQPGAYRVEATRHTKPWIISNPIYVRATEEKVEGGR